jgi:hypothetical protein
MGYKEKLEQSLEVCFLLLLIVSFKYLLSLWEDQYPARDITEPPGRRQRSVDYHRMSLYTFRWSHYYLKKLYVVTWFESLGTWFVLW